MMPKSRVLLACILALLTAGEPAWGQAPPHFKNETDVETWLNNVPAFASVKEVLVCIDNKLFRAVLIFRPYLLFEPVNLAGRPNPCDPSNDDNGAPLSGPNVQAAGPSGSGAGQSGMAAPAPRAASVAAAITPAFPVPLAFRSLFLPPSYSQVSPPLTAPPACNPASPGNAFQVNHLAGTVTRFFTCSGNVIATIPVTSNPLQVQVTPDGTTALVTSFDGVLNYIDTAANKTVFQLQMPGISPSGIAISPDGVTAYVTSLDSGPGTLLAMVNIAQRRVVQTIPFSTAYPQSVFFSPDGAQAYVTFPLSSGVAVIDTLTFTNTRTLPVRNPYAVAFNSTGTLAYISSGTSPGTLQIYDTATFRMLKSVTVGNQPVDILAMPDDGPILVNNFVGASISVIDPLSYAVTTIALPGKPRGFVQVR